MDPLSAIAVALGTGWFLLTTLFWKKSDATHRAEVEKFIARLDTPVDFAREEGAAAANDSRQAAAVGWLCLAYGGFVALLSLVPNPMLGRLAFLGCGGLVFMVGALLVRTSRRPTSSPASGVS